MINQSGASPDGPTLTHVRKTRLAGVDVHGSRVVHQSVQRKTSRRMDATRSAGIIIDSSTTRKAMLIDSSRVTRSAGATMLPLSCLPACPLRGSGSGSGSQSPT